jgi:tetratricopeptide (TPR) repeat protein
VHEEVLAEEDPAPPAREPAVAAAAPARPFQLPADTGDFGGRDEVRDEILAELGDDDPDRLATPVVVLVGKPGVGKSALAVHVAHRLRDRFPDGQLYCELGGSGYEPVPPAEVLARFARALGAPGSAIPDDEVGRAELYRTLVAGRRMLVVLEDAAGEQQVRALLPGTGSCAVIVTSRTMLTGLPGAAVHELDVLDPQRARELLARVVGAQRVAAEPATADALVRMVGNLPLALRIVAARLAARPRWPLAVMVERLTDERRRLDELTHGELMMRASLAMSYDGLDPAAARLLRLLGLVEVDSYPVWLAAALLDATESEAAWLLELLVDVHLLEVAALDLDGTPRYRFHLIIRLFARERLHDTEPPEERTAAVLRAAGAWLALVDEAHRRLYGGDFIALRSPAPRRPPARRTVGRLLSDPLAWLEAERANLSAFVATAAAAGPAAAAACWDLAVGMVDLFESGAYHDDWATTHRTALRVAADAGDRRGEAAVLASLGTLHLTRGRTEEAERVLDRALALFTELGDTAGTALVQRDRAWVDQVRGDDAAAARGYRAALAGFESVGDPVGRAHVLGRLADTELAAGAPERARELLEQALELVRDIGNARVELQTLFRLGTVALAQGRLDEAEAVLAPLLERVRLRRDLVGEARVLQQLAAVRVRAGAPGDAVELLERAVEVRERGRDRAGAAELRDELERARAAAATAAADRA